MKQKLKSGDEYDAMSKWARKYLCVFHNNTGIAKKIKRALNKRFRKEGKRELEKEI